MANSFYNEALDLLALNEIEESGNQQNLVSINTLFDKAIKNAQIIEKDFYETKYIDDAYFILGMSSFYQNKISASKYYFERIYNEYNEDDFFNKSIIMLSKLHLKMGDSDKFNFYITMINDKDLNKDEKVMFYLALVEYDDYNESINGVIKNSLLAIDYTQTKTQKIPIYYNLLKIAENDKNYIDAIYYINQIEYCLDDQKINNDLLSKWIDYNTTLENFEIISEKLDSYIQLEMNLKSKIYYNLKLIENYMNSKNYSKANNELNDLLDIYKDNGSLKAEVSNIYFLLGQLELEFNSDFEKAKFFFQESIDNSRISEYGKNSDSYMKIINEYNDVQYLIETSDLDLSNSDVTLDENEQDIISLNMDVDSLLYLSGQILFYDLDLKDLALQKFQDIIDNYPESNYRYKSMILLDMENLGKDIEFDLNEEHNVDNNLTKLDSLIDDAWDLLLISRKKSIKKFHDIHSNYSDEKSLFIIGKIYDNYEKNIDSTVYYYNKYLSTYSKGKYIMQISDRLEEIRDMLDYKISYLNQKIDFRKAMDFFDNNYDSSIYYFDLAKNGRDREIKKFSQNNLEALNRYHINDSLYKINYKNLDSVRINIASILYKNLNLDSSAITIYKDIINNSDDITNVNNSLSSMAILDVDSQWDSLLFINTQDSNLFNLLIDKAKRDNIYTLKNNLKSDKIDINFYREKYKLFINE
tara:strand:- start:3736 stop:5829 length:2094 start_codon:yes stop_codon:yes gene_type:complete